VVIASEMTSAPPILALAVLPAMAEIDFTGNGRGRPYCH
jgi:hypothetical protein